MSCINAMRGRKRQINGRLFRDGPSGHRVVTCEVRRATLEREDRRELELTMRDDFFD